MVLRPGQCAGCREIDRIRGLLEERNAVIRRLELENEALKRQPDGAGQRPPRRKRMLYQPSITEIPIVT
jgi:hypothetical protein